MVFMQKYPFFVQHNSMLRWCPAAGCSMAIRDNGLLHGNRQNCECRCGHRCCFNCGNDYHDPIECDLYAKWKKDDNDETAIYLHKNTRRCPNTKCNAPIEKNGGCNYMVKEMFSCFFFLSLLIGNL